MAICNKKRKKRDINLLKYIYEHSSIGRTAVSKTVYEGSSPSARAIFLGVSPPLSAKLYKRVFRRRSSKRGILRVLKQKSRSAAVKIAAVSFGFLFWAGGAEYCAALSFYIRAFCLWTKLKGVGLVSRPLCVV